MSKEPDEKKILAALGPLTPAQTLEIKTAVRMANVVNELVDEGYSSVDALICVVVWAATIMEKKCGHEVALTCLNETAKRLGNFAAFENMDEKGPKH